MVVLSMRDAATMQATEAARRGSTRLLEYLSCDGSRSGGGGAFVPDWRRSIIPRVYRCVLTTSSWGSPAHAVFAFPGLGLAGLLAFQATGDVFEPEERLSLNNSCGARDVCRLPQAIFCRDLAWLASVLRDAS